MKCRALQHRLQVDAENLSPEERAHMAECTECTAHRGLARDLETLLAHKETQSVADALLARVETEARIALEAARLPRLFRREVTLALALAALALPLAVAQGWLWLQTLFLALEAWLPFPLLAGMAALYVASVGISLGFLYASLPFAVAYSRRIQAEAS
jgi:hypothetical protein